MYEITTEIGFEAAHKVEGHPKCGKLHGHSWRLVVCLGGRSLGTTSDYDYLIDFGEVKTWLREIAPDHEYLNDLYSFSPTSENLAQHFYTLIAGKLADLNERHHQSNPLDAIFIMWVEVWEGPNNHARFS